MTVYVLLETCCSHFKGVFATKAEAEARRAEREEPDWSIEEWEVN